MLEIAGGIILAIIVLAFAPVVLFCVIYVIAMVFYLGWMPLGVFALYQLTQGNEQFAAILGLCAVAWGAIGTRKFSRRDTA